MATLSLPPASKELALVYHLSGLTEKSLKLSTLEKGEAFIKLSGGTQIIGNTSIAEFIVSSAKDEKIKGLMGKSPEEKAEVKRWNSFASKLKANDPNSLDSTVKVLDSYLSTRTFMVSNYLTLSDVTVFANLYSYMHRNCSNQTMILAIPSVVRHFDFIQHILPNSEIVGDLVSFTLNVPLSSKQIKENNTAKASSEESPKKVQANKLVDGAQDSSKDLSATAKETKHSKKKEKKEKTNDSGGKENRREKKEAKKEEKNDEVNPSRLDLRIGLITNCKKHEAADSLYVEEIDAGEDSPRIVVSGLVNHVKIEDMQKRYVVLLCNLKPAAMRGVKSHAMVMCTTGADGKVDILQPPKGSEPGDRVYFEGFKDGQPDDVLNPKKKVWESIQPYLKTIDDLSANFVDPKSGKVCKMMTDKGVIKSKTVKGGSIK